MHALSGVEAQTVETKFIDPVAGICDKELAHGPGIFAIEVDGLTPLVLISVREVALREACEVIPVRTKMVVDDVQDDRETEAMRDLDEAAQVVGVAIEAGRREQVYAVIGPPEVTGEVVDRHHLNDGN